MDGITIKEIGAFISGAGFSVFVATFLLLRTQNTLEKLTAAINRLCDKLDREDHHAS